MRPTVPRAWDGSSFSGLPARLLPACGPSRPRPAPPRLALRPYVKICAQPLDKLSCMMYKNAMSWHPTRDAGRNKVGFGLALWLAANVLDGDLGRGTGSQRRGSCSSRGFDGE